jgi:DGQHR domain-containing protein
MTTNGNGGDLQVLDAPALRTGTPVVIGVVEAGRLVSQRVVPRRDHKRKTGYQREVSVTRVNRLVSELKSGRVDLPTAVLLNVRDYDAGTNLVRRDGRKYLHLSDDQSFFVVDGQHRIEALTRIVEEDPDRWNGYEIAFVCMLGADEREEMREFYVVNSTAKSVRTDLALDLLKQQAEADPNIMDGLVESSEDWKVRAQTIVEELTHRSTVWRGRIRFPGEPKADTTIGNAGLANTLKQLLATPYFGQVTTENQVKILDAYWQGIRKVLPEVFDEPLDFVIQKSTGTMVMHTLLISLLEYVRSVGKSVIEPTSFADTLEDTLLELQGDTRDGNVVTGADFWRSGAAGAAGSFSSNAGRRVLTAKIRARLPKPEVD